jgi:hypothetical protein
MYIIPLIIIGIVIIVWLQYPDIKDDETTPIERKIFDRIKIPVIFICSILIIYLLYGCKENNEIIETLPKAYMSIPNF